MTDDAAAPGGFVTRDALTAPARHHFLSPHYDDVTLSCGGTAALLSRAGRTPEVALIFGAEPDPTAPLTEFARQMHEGWGLDAAGVIAGRRAEEAAAAAIIGTRVTFLPLLDAIYRGDRYTNNDELFGRPAADEAGLPDEVFAALALPERPEAGGGTRLYAPLGVGNHVDHQPAFVAGVRLARRGWEVWFYEDLPYALRAGAVEGRLAATGERLTVAGLVDVEPVWEAKLEAILRYPSQLATIFAYVGVGATRAEIDGVMRGYAVAAGGGKAAERFWRLAEIEAAPGSPRAPAGEAMRESTAGGY